MKELTAVFIIISIFVLLVILTRILRFIYNFIRCLYLTRKYKPKYDKETKKMLYNKHSLPDSLLQRDQEAEKQLKEDIKKYNEAKELVKKSETKIIGIAEPLGIWTEFVTKQKLSWLKAMIGTKADSDKFWQNIIEAQKEGQGKKKGRGR